MLYAGCFGTFTRNVLYSASFFTSHVYFIITDSWVQLYNKSPLKKCGPAKDETINPAVDMSSWLLLDLRKKEKWYRYWPHHPSSTPTDQVTYQQSTLTPPDPFFVSATWNIQLNICTVIRTSVCLKCIEEVKQFSGIKAIPLIYETSWVKY